MRKLIDHQIKTLSQILEDIKKLEPNEELDKSLKENKYVKEITNKYFNIDEDIIRTINRHLSLTKELKENHIRLTDKQKEQESKYKKYIKEIEETLDRIIKLLKQLEKETTYIDLETIEILKINEIDTLKKVIEYNQRITLKRKGMLQEEPENKQENTEKIKSEQKKETITEQTTKTPIVEEIEPEKILMFSSIEEINKYTKEKYDTTIKTESNIEELNNMIELLENKPFDTLNHEQIKKLLEQATYEKVSLIKILMENKKYKFEELKHLDDLLSSDSITFLSTFEIYNNVDNEEQRNELFEKNLKRKEKLLRNLAIVRSYDIYSFPLNLLTKSISIEKLEQLSEVGHLKELYIIEELYKKVGDIKNCQVEEMLAKISYPNIYLYYFYTTIFNKSIASKNKNLIIYENILKEPQEPKSIIKMKQLVFEKLREEKTISALIRNDQIKLEQYTSSNPILKAEEETNRKSKENFISTFIPFWNKEHNPIYKSNNPYFEALEKKYSKEKKPYYKIPIKTTLCEAGEIIISKNKVIRLLNEHLIENHEITKEIVKQCVMYNIIITDELLHELEEKLDDLFNKLDDKQEKKLKSIK